MEETKTQTVAEFITKHGIEFKTRRTDRNPAMADDEWHRTATHWACRFRYDPAKGDARALSVVFSMGSGQEPTAVEVLDCIASDSAGYEDAGGFEDWVEDYGYDPGSKRAKRTFRAVEAQAHKLRRFLGLAAYEELLWNTERE